MKFPINSTVRATAKIWNQKGTVLQPGGLAKVRNRFPPDADAPTIVDLVLPDGSLLIDITSPEKVLEEVS